MDAKVDYVIRGGAAVIQGPVGENELHKNACVIALFRTDGVVSVENAEGRLFQGTGLLIKPLTDHKIIGRGIINNVYISPHLRFSRWVLEQSDDAEICDIDLSTWPFSGSDHPSKIVNAIEAQNEQLPYVLDPRLEAALEELKTHLNSSSVAQVAENVDVSRSRLRALAREQLGVPLSAWLTWQKTLEACRSLTDGNSLTQAAFDGGFSDQAHFCRTIKMLFGITPMRLISALEK